MKILKYITLFHFLFSGAVVIAPPLAFASKIKQKLYTLNPTLPIVQGFTNKNSTQISILVPTQSTYKYAVGRFKITSKLFIQEYQVKKFIRPKSPWRIDQLYINNLMANEVYVLSVRNSDGELIDSRTFKSLDTSISRPRFLVAGQINLADLEHQDQIFREFFNKKPNFVLMLGNFINLDLNLTSKNLSTGDLLWDAYVQTWRRLKYFLTPHLVPTLANWGPSNFGNVSSSQNMSVRAEAADIFGIFIPQKCIESRDLICGPGTTRMWNAFGSNFVFLDSITFQKNSNPAITQKLNLGAAQIKWIFKNAQKSKEPLWIVGGQNLFGGFDLKKRKYLYYFDEGTKNLTEMLRKLRRPYFVITGGTSKNELIKLGPPNHSYQTYEVHAGPFLGRSEEPTFATPKPNRRAKNILTPQSYLLIESFAKKTKLSLKLTSYKKGNSILLKRFITVKKSGKH